MGSDLQSHLARLDDASLKDLAAARLSETLSACGWYVNLSRQYLDAEADQALLAFAGSQNVGGAIKALFDGEHVNASEDRPAMHWALRLPPGRETGFAEEIRASLDPALAFADKVRDGDVLPSIETVLHIGIGGSDLGPRLLHDAFVQSYGGKIGVRFASNIDPLDLERALDGLNPRTTLVIGISKSFSTQETKYNLDRARDWLKKTVGANWPKHLAIVTANPGRANDWLGIESDQLFDMPESIGGRFSLWSAGSLSCMIAFGTDWFRALLKGANDMDTHVRTSPLVYNMALRLALIDYWNMTLRNVDAEMVLAYANALRLLPAYLQQLLLESNGKQVAPDGSRAPAPSIVGHWGGEGTIGQHSYHQWLHQGSSHVAAEFVIAATPGSEPKGTSALIAHALAQAEVLANGYKLEDINENEPDIDPAIANQKVIPGGKPSMIFACRDFGPEALGALIALYEHRVFLGGVLWGVNSFDQWGVERGKVQAGRILEALGGSEAASDPVTRDMVDYFR
ncbi:MAG: glucose-6-phosphate isomerase [Ponticaulis sp.]|nr:glucose-6-phosphate isomerase [Ponticaulis sp.]